MAEFAAICVDGQFEIAGGLGGNHIYCSGTLENRSPPIELTDLTSDQIGELMTAVLTFFVICACIKWVRGFFDANSSGRSG